MLSLRTILIAGCCAGLAACSIKSGFFNEYKIDVQQGNVLTQDMVAQLKPGQTREQVRFILGTPMVADAFHQTRWDYLYRFRDGRTGKVEGRDFTVFFDANGRLARVAGQVDVASVEELTTPVARTRVVDLGALPETPTKTAAAPAAVPTAAANEEKPGFFRRMMNWIGL